MYIYIIDDDDAVRESTELLLSTSSFDATIQTFSSAEKFFSKNLLGHSGCVLLDIRMPGMDGVEALKEITAADSNLVVVMISGHGDIPKAVETMKAGAFSFVEKPFSDTAITEVVTSALQQSEAQQEEAELRTHAIAAIEKLTPREKEVLDKLVLGLLNKVIAYELGISTRTVEVHRARIMEKLDVRSLPEMVRLCLLAEGKDNVMSSW
ncbi:response regulator transcription factor [Kiloniella sp. EL199]|uniref:response regulator transcription factor n=1 Tax=Kiloniella sp. EL199 TaxID=2107581 RepID=UPI000EA06462|nr:response regulator [Kiloniella sp. EL199]